MVFEKRKGNRGDRILIGLTSEAGENYCFKYQNGVMWSFSFNENFKNGIISISDSKRRLDGRPKYIYSFKNEDWFEKFNTELRKKY